MEFKLTSLLLLVVGLVFVSTTRAQRNDPYNIEVARNFEDSSQNGAAPSDPSPFKNGARPSFRVCLFWLGQLNRNNLSNTTQTGMQTQTATVTTTQMANNNNTATQTVNNSSNMEANTLHTTTLNKPDNVIPEIRFGVLMELKVKLPRDCLENKMLFKFKSQYIRNILIFNRTESNVIHASTQHPIPWSELQWLCSQSFRCL